MQVIQYLSSDGIFGSVRHIANENGVPCCGVWEIASPQDWLVVFEEPTCMFCKRRVEQTPSNQQEAA